MYFSCYLMKILVDKHRIVTKFIRKKFLFVCIKYFIFSLMMDDCSGFRLILNINKQFFQTNID